MQVPPVASHKSSLLHLDTLLLRSLPRLRLMYVGRHLGSYNVGFLGLQRLLLGHGAVAGVGLGRPGPGLAQAQAQAPQARADLGDGPVDGALHGVEAAQQRAAAAAGGGGGGGQGGVGGVAQAARLPGLVGCNLGKSMTSIQAKDSWTQGGRRDGGYLRVRIPEGSLPPSRSPRHQSRRCPRPSGGSPWQTRGSETSRA